MKKAGSEIDITLEVVCGKWKGLILWKLLHEKEVRFNELRRSIEGNISPRILSRELRKLMDDGLIERIDYGISPPRVEYRITTYGKTTSPFLKIMNDWGMEHKRLNATKKEMAQIINKDEPEVNHT
ncbi:winged helix-turn-helix transcriptional regulator [Halobacillus naozhouensis]|uniref:Helix-turn-helix domain-containing protein n=1 Tax=Halobacillus naozhouensis TaxID=554880 RepID=A0ABY8IZQ4_9BACI|nr:helix-turn-helix domain-containing protein [Halobacillus naozhouensis]WFT74679.1 helix-turn-helix domain-containing protein [Halobacillus naozhouensis]